jgi:hypothetical protein
MVGKTADTLEEEFERGMSVYCLEDDSREAKPLFCSNYLLGRRRLILVSPHMAAINDTTADAYQSNAIVPMPEAPYLRLSENLSNPFSDNIVQVCYGTHHPFFVVSDNGGEVNIDDDDGLVIAVRDSLLGIEPPVSLSSYLCNMTALID